MNPARMLARHQGPESAEAFAITTVGPIVWASRTMLQPTTRQFNQWQIAPAGQIRLNGKVDQSTQLVTELVYHNNTLFQGTSRPDWYYWNTATSDGTLGNAGWVFFNLLGPIQLSATTYPAGAVAGTVIATVSVAMSPNAANDTFPGAWGGTLTLGGVDAANFVISGTTLSVAVGHTLTNSQYNITLSAQILVGAFSLGNPISATAFQLNQIAQPESAEAFSVTTVGPIVFASKTNFVASSGPFNQFALTSGGQTTVNGILQPTSNVVALVYHDHSLFQEDTTPQTESAEAFSVTTVGPVVSASGTNRIASSGPYNQFALTAGGQITLNSVLLGSTSGIIALVYHNHTLFSEG